MGKLLKIAKAGRFSFLGKCNLFLLLVFSFILDTMEGFSRASICLAIFALVYLFFKERKVFLIKNFVWPFIFLIFNILSIFWGGDANTIMQVSSAIIIGYVIFAGLKYGMPISTLLWAIVIAAAMNIVFSLKNPVYFQGFTASRIKGLVGNANSLSVFLSFAAFLLYFLNYKKNLVIKSVVISLLLFVFFYTGSRQGLLLISMITLFIGADYLLWQKVRMRSQRFFVICLILIIFLGAYLKKFSEIRNDVIVIQRVEELLRGEDKWSGQVRYSMIEEGIKLWLEKPVLGWGGGGFSMYSGFGTYAHNNYMELLTDYGIMGFCLYYIFYIYLIVTSWRLRTRYLPRIGLLITIMFFILELGHVSLGDKTSWIVLGIATYCIFSQKERLI